MLMVCGEGNGNPLQCSCLENPRNGGAWWVAVYGVAQSWTQLKRLSSSSSSNGLWRYIPYELVFSFWFLIGCCILFHTFPVYFTISPYFTTFQGGKYGMEKAMAPHSRTLAWKISWMEEPGRLHSMGSLPDINNWKEEKMTEGPAFLSFPVSVFVLYSPLCICPLLDIRCPASVGKWLCSLSASQKVTEERRLGERTGRFA